PLVLMGRWYLWIIAGLIMAAYFAWSPSERRRTVGYLQILKLVLGFLTAIILIFKASPLGALPETRGLVPPFFVLVPPLCWLVLYGHPENGRDQHVFPRTLLCTLAVLQLLYAYPIAGSQFAFVQILPTIVVMICMGDCLSWLRTRSRCFPPVILRAATPI